LKEETELAKAAKRMEKETKLVEDIALRDTYMRSMATSKECDTVDDDMLGKGR
jgi:hypothetical protein